MAWGAVHNVAHYFFGELPAPNLKGNHPFRDWRRYVKPSYLPDSRSHRRISPLRLETALGLQILWHGREA